MSTLRVTNVGKHQLPHLDQSLPLISIYDKYSYRASIPNEANRPVLNLCFFPGDHLDVSEKTDALTPEQAKSVVEFVKEHKDKGQIFVQCGEGRIRSWTICSSLVRTPLDIEHDTTLSAIKSGVIDRVTHNVMRTTIREMEAKGEFV